MIVNKKLESLNSISDPNTKVISLKNINFEHKSIESSTSNKISNFYKEIIESLDSEGELSNDWEVRDSSTKNKLDHLNIFLFQGCFSGLSNSIIRKITKSI